MVSVEGDLEKELDAQAFTCSACRSCAVSRYRMERSAMVGETTTMCLNRTIVEKFVTGDDCG